MNVRAIIRSFKYRLRPTKNQRAALDDILYEQRQLYNAALEERIGAYRKAGKSIGLYDQQKSLTEIRKEDLPVSTFPVSLSRGTLIRADGAFKRFFSGIKSGKKVGFPRFKSKSSFTSFSFSEFSGIRLSGNAVIFKGSRGKLRFHLHRPLPDKPDIVTCQIGKDAKGWFVCFQVKLPRPNKIQVNSVVGVDLGVASLATLSDGSKIVNQRPAKRHQDELKRRQRKLSRAKKGSNRRLKTKNRLARTHQKIANSRKTYLHQVSAQLLKDHEVIIVENLKTANMMRNHSLAGAIQDAGWNTLVKMLLYKAENAGKQVILVNPNGTSQQCSGCGSKVPKKLSEREHCCVVCGLVMDRDHNAAVNILNKAVVGLGLPNVEADLKRVAGSINLNEKPE